MKKLIKLLLTVILLLFTPTTLLAQFNETAPGINYPLPIPSTTLLNRLIPSQSMAAFLANPSPVVVFVGDSLFTINGGNSIAETELQYSIICRMLQSYYPEKNITFVNMAISGSTEQQFLSTGSSIGVGVLPAAWNQTTFPPASSTWSQVTGSFNADLIFMSWGMNGTNQYTFLKPNLTAIAGYTKIPGIILITNKQASKQPQFGFNSVTTQNKYLTNASIWRSAVTTGVAQKYWGLTTLPPIGLIDTGRFANMVLNGFDPVNQYLVQQIGAVSGLPITGITSFPYNLPATQGGDFLEEIVFPGQASTFSAGTGLGVIQLFIDGQSTVVQIRQSSGAFLPSILLSGGIGGTGSLPAGGTIGTGDIDIQLIVKGTGLTLICNGTVLFRNFQFAHAQTPGYLPQVALTITSGASMSLTQFDTGVPQLTIPLISDVVAYPANFPSGNGPQGGGTGKHGSSGFTSLTDYQVFDAAFLRRSPSSAQTINFQPGLITAITSTKGDFGKLVNASTVDNITGSANLFTCASNPTITMYECGTDTTCAAPTTIGSVTVTAAGQAFDGTVSNSAISAAHYIAWAISAGTCTSLDISASAEVHTN